jgi:hypothetical protein
MWYDMSLDLIRAVRAKRSGITLLRAAIDQYSRRKGHVYAATGTTPPSALSSGNSDLLKMNTPGKARFSQLTGRA